MDDITIGVTEFVNNISVSAQPNDQIIDITVTETVETVLLDVSTTVEEVTVTATQNVIVENITVDYVNNENNIDINVTDGTQDVTLNITPTLVEINILRSGGEVNILQFNTLADFPATGSSDYFYLAKDTNKLYRWTGSAYAEISATSNAVWGQIIGTLSEQTDLQNALNLKAPINSPTFTGTVSGITKTMVGLGAVDNTSDLDKPISTATQSALNNKQPLDGDLTSIAALSGTFGLLKKTANNSYTIDTNTYLTSITSSDVTTALGFTPENAANKGVNNGYASLDGGGKVPSSQLPSYVDDVIEVANYGSLPSTGETGKIYITLDTNKIYRWSGSVYVEISGGASVWGGITGTLSNQTDLQSALDAKLSTSTAASTYVPYTGATTNVDLGEYNIKSGAFKFDLTPSGTLAEGTMQWNSSDGTVDIGLKGGNVVLQVGQETVYEVRNETGSTILNGTALYANGVTAGSGRITAGAYVADGSIREVRFLGLATEDISNGVNGFVTHFGYVRGLDTRGTSSSSISVGDETWAVGDILYVHPTVAGKLTNVKPQHEITVAIIITRHQSSGVLFVRPSSAGHLEDIHDVAISSVANNQGLFYESSTSLWKNKSISTVLGYTPANGADYMALTGSQSISGTKTFTGFGLFDNTIFIKQDSSVSFLAGYNSIDSDTTGIIFSLPAGNMAKFILTSLSASRDYTLPNASGTIALTSDIPSLAGYVATTGDQSISGNKTFTTAVLANLLKFNESGGFNNVPGYTQIGGTADNFIFINGAGTKQAQFIYNSGGGNNYTLPTGNGTLALTSDLHNAVTIGTANGLSLSTQVLSLALASTSATGALSSTDWNTFNGKQNALTNPVTGTGTSSYLPKFTGTSAIGNSLLYDTGSALLIGATSASDGQSKLELVSASTVGLKIISSGANGNNTFLSIQASKEWRFVTNRGDLISGNQGDLIIRNNTDGINHIILNQGGSTTFAGALSGTSATFSGAIAIGAGTQAINADAELTLREGNAFVGLDFQSARTSGNLGGIRIYNTSSTTDAIAQLLVEVDGKFSFYNNNSATPRFTIASTGAATFSSSVTASGGVNAEDSKFFNSVQLTDSLGGTCQGFLWTDAANTLKIGTGTVAGGNVKMTITSTGNVGIGTTAPGGALEVRTGTGGNLRVRLNGSNNLLLQNYNETDNYRNMQFAASTLQFLTETEGGGGADERMRITSGGAVGIGTTSVTAGKLQIVGDAGVYTNWLQGSSTTSNSYGLMINAGTNSSDYSMYVRSAAQGSPFIYIRGDGYLYSASAWSGSDRRLKENISDLEGGLNKILGIKARKFDFINGFKNQFGFIAQELQTVIPEAVSVFDETNNMLAIKSDFLVPHLVKAVQEEDAKIIALQNKVTELETEIQTLKNK